jgi:hypothetical protein
MQIRGVLWHRVDRPGNRVVPRPSDASIAAARNDVLAALWGPSW